MKNLIYQLDLNYVIVIVEMLFNILHVKEIIYYLLKKHKKIHITNKLNVQ